jgi:hypothetical protein
MIPARTPAQLLTVCKTLWMQKITNCLLTGGADKNGSLPWLKFTDTIKKIKQITGLCIAIHTGLLDFKTALSLKKADVDVALLDIVGSDKTISEILHINREVTDFENTLKFLTHLNFKVVPHIVIGLHKGKVVGEYDAIDLAAKYNPSLTVFVILTPLRNTPFYNVKIPLIKDIENILAYGCEKIGCDRIALGCMRPRGKYSTEVEKIAIAQGIRKIAVPSENAITYLKENYRITIHNSCCAFS